MNVTKRKSVFKTLNMPDSQPFTFQDAFSVDHSGKIIRHYWDLFRGELESLTFLGLKPIDQFNLLLQRSQGTPTKTLAMGILMIMGGDESYRSIRKQFESKYHPRTLKRLYDELKELQHNRNNPFEFIATISQIIEMYKPLQMQEYWEKSTLSEDPRPLNL